MVYWKIDDETIRCLINKDEINQLGYDLNSLSKDSSLMSDFLATIIEDSHKYINWNTDNGVQNFIARALPADQFLLTISCTFPDKFVNPDIQQIKQIFEALNRNFGKDAVDENNKMSQEEPLQEDQKRDRSSDTLPPQKMVFKDMNSLLEFTSLLDKRLFFPSRLYRDHDQYILLLDIDERHNNVDIITLIITAEEFGAECDSQNLSPYYLQEHADLLIGENALSILRSFSN